MNSIGTREKRLAAIFGIFLVCVILYVFPIRLLNNSTIELQAQRDALQAQKDYYDALASQNEATRQEIQRIEDDISDVEATFLPMLNTECLQQWTLDVFESNGCPYLAETKTYDVAGPEIMLPDGSYSDDAVVIKCVDVTYSTTDGWNVPSYNGTNSVYSEDGLVDPALIEEQMSDRHYEGMYSRVGYDEFIAALKVIEGTNEDCIKVTNISVEQKSGYLLMSATINFYSATFTNRVSEANTSAPYVSWNGMTGIATDHGFIGKPFFVDDRGSDWYGCIMSDTDASDRERPFAAYYSAATWANLVESQGTLSALGLSEDFGITTESSTPDDAPEGDGEVIDDIEN